MSKIPTPETNAAARTPLIVGGGPTASGKSALAVALAERLGGVVINADSMQLYHALLILTPHIPEEPPQHGSHRD